jgi:hypothetical protein
MQEVLYPEYYVLITRRCNYPVSVVMLRHVERELSRWPRPRWITFVDLAGARIRLRPAVIEGSEQSSPETRAWQRRVIAEWINEEEKESPDG